MTILVLVLGAGGGMCEDEAANEEAAVTSLAPREVVAVKGYEVRVPKAGLVPVQMHSLPDLAGPVREQQGLRERRDRLRLGASGESPGVAALPPPLARAPATSDRSRNREPVWSLDALSGTGDPEAPDRGAPSWGWLADGVMAAERRQKAETERSSRRLSPFELNLLQGKDLMGGGDRAQTIWPGLPQE